MFKSTDLPYIIQFSVMFHSDQPVDWLLDPIIETRYCPHDTVKRKETIKVFQYDVISFVSFLVGRHVD